MFYAYNKRQEKDGVEKVLDKVGRVWYFDMVEVLLVLMELRFISTGLTDV